MKRYFKRSVSLWAAFMMLFNVILPTGSFAELGGNIGLGGTEVIAPPSKDYTVTSILGNGVYYGIVAEKAMFSQIYLEHRLASCMQPI